jgi:hypothetical protein
MSIEMMDVGGLSLSSPTPGYGFKPEAVGAASDIPTPQSQGRQPSAEEERLKDKLREAQEQVCYLDYCLRHCMRM